jgi:hypothetical protein
MTFSLAKTGVFTQTIKPKTPKKPDPMEWKRGSITARYSVEILMIAE